MITNNGTPVFALCDTHPNWTRKLKTLGDNTQTRYERVIRKLREYVIAEMASIDCPATMEDLIYDYFEFLHESGITEASEDDDTGAKGMKASGLWGIHSIVNTFFELTTTNFKLNTNCQLLAASLKKYGNEEETKQSETFEKSDVLKFMSKPNSPKVLLSKVYIATGISGAFRQGENLAAKFSDLEKKFDPNGGNGIYVLTFFRSKRRGGKKVQERCLIKDPLYVKAIDDYVALFTEDQRKLLDGRLFRYLEENSKTGKLKGTIKPVGKTTLGNTAKFVAEAMNLPNVQKFTSHAWRRTSVTWLANNGATGIELVTAAGWASVETSKIYINNSNIIKESIAGKLSLTDSVSSSTQIVPSTAKLSTTSYPAPCTNSNSSINLNLSNAQGNVINLTISMAPQPAPQPVYCQDLPTSGCQTLDEFVAECAPSDPLPVVQSSKRQKICVQETMSTQRMLSIFDADKNAPRNSQSKTGTPVVQSQDSNDWINLFSQGSVNSITM